MTRSGVTRIFTQRGTSNMFTEAGIHHRNVYMKKYDKLAHLITHEQLFSVIEDSAKRHSWFREYQSAAGLHPKPLKGLSETRWNCQGRNVEVVRSRLPSVNETLQRIRDESADRKVTGDAVGLLTCTSKLTVILWLK